VTYTRKEAVADGVQVDVSKLAREAAITYPVFLTSAVHHNYVSVPDGVYGQDETGRLWDILMTLRFAIRRAKGEPKRLPFELYVANDNNEPKLVHLTAVCSALDIDDPQPAITVMLPDED
jgi:hypothetical protein